jgi:hypothetical protein
MAKQPTTPIIKPQTKVIDNFTGRLTRIINGDMNSGYAKFSSSFGYDPFSFPGNLTWLYQPTDIKGSVITDAVLSAKLVSDDSTARYVYGIGNSSRLYKIDPTNSASTDTPLFDSPSVISAIGSVSGTFDYGADMEYYNGSLQISSDAKVTRVNLSGSVVGVNSVTGALYHPQVQFLGKLYVGNGNNLVEIDTTNTVTNGAKLNPGLPTGMYITDLDVTPDGVYMVISASFLYPTNISSPNGSSDRGSPYAVESSQFLWNGTDAGITSSKVLPAFPATALNTFLDKRYYFMNDAFGMALFEGNTKLLTLPQNAAPMPDASTPNGTFLTWVAPEVTGDTINSSTGTGTNTYHSLYYFGNLDGENVSGLWRFMRLAPSASNQVWRTPLNLMVNNYSFSRQFVAGWGKHYISAFEYNSGATSNTYHFYRFVLPPAADTAPILGVYETQNQLFSKRIGISQIRVYCEPTTTNNAFQLDMIGGDGNVVTNGSFTYTYGDQVDTATGAVSIERINFNPGTKTLYSLGIRITNTGTSNMKIRKVEIDYTEEGK